jgi:hypothetical protein
MYPIKKCMTTLRLLIADGNPHCIPGAESAIDELIAVHDAPQQGVRALHALEEELTPIWNFASGKQLHFVNVLFDYIAARIRGLGKSAAMLTVPPSSTPKKPMARPPARRSRFSLKRGRNRPR